MERIHTLKSCEYVGVARVLTKECLFGEVYSIYVADGNKKKSWRRSLLLCVIHTSQHTYKVKLYK
jgi:hypothetical protein